MITTADGVDAAVSKIDAIIRRLRGKGRDHFFIQPRFGRVEFVHWIDNLQIVRLEIRDDRPSLHMPGWTIEPITAELARKLRDLRDALDSELRAA